MRALPGLFVTLATATAPCVADAQGLPHPDSLRAPAVSWAEGSVALRQAAMLVLAQIEQAITARDTVSVVALVPDAVIPESEWSRVRQLGCRSLSQVLARLDLLSGGRSATSTHLTIDNASVIASVETDLLITADAKLFRGALELSAIRFTFAGSGDAIQLVGAVGLLQGLCEASVG